MPDHLCLSLYEGLLDAAGSSLVLLDWDYRVPRPAAGRIRHLKADWGHIGLEPIAALMQYADLLIGVDFGPLHDASLIPGLRTLGLWTAKFRGTSPSDPTATRFTWSASLPES